MEQGWDELRELFGDEGVDEVEGLAEAERAAEIERQRQPPEVTCPIGQSAPLVFVRVVSRLPVRGLRLTLLSVS